MTWSATRAGRTPSMIRPMTPRLQRAAYHCASTVRKATPERAAGGPRSYVRVKYAAHAAAENTSDIPPGRGNGARAARGAAPGVQPPNTTLGKPTRTNCAIGGAAAKLRRLVWFGIRGPLGHTTGGLRFGASPRSPAAPRVASSGSLSCPALTRGGVAGAMLTDRLIACL